MRLVKFLSPLAVVLLSAVISSSAFARPAKTVVVYKPVVVKPHAVKSYAVVGPKRAVKPVRAVKVQQPVVIVYKSNSVKHRHIRRLSAIQQAKFEQAFLSAVALNNPATIYWTDKGATGSVRVVNNASLGNGCRSYVQTVTIGGEQETLSGVACRQVDNSWKIVS